MYFLLLYNFYKYYKYCCFLIKTYSMQGSHIVSSGSLHWMNFGLQKNSLVEGFHNAKGMSFDDFKLKQQHGDAFLILTKKTSKVKSLFAFLKFSIFLSKKLPGETEQVPWNKLNSLKSIRFSQDKITFLFQCRV